MVESKVTRSPGRRSRTSAPAAATSPAASWPITSGGMRRPVEPSNPCTSLPQMPQARTRISTSPGPISGSGIGANSSFMYSVNSSAFIQVNGNSGNLRRAAGVFTVDSLPPTGIDRARAIFWLQLASLLATAWVIWKIAIIPFVPIGVGFTGFLPQTIFLALWYSLAALLLSGAITFLLLLAVRRIERTETIRVTLRACGASAGLLVAARDCHRPGAGGDCDARPLFAMADDSETGSRRSARAARRP